MINSKDDFIKSHARVGGSKLAEEMYKQLQAKIAALPDCPTKAYLSATGNEVHVNGPVAASVNKPESLQEKIARFDRLAEKVAASRALMYGLSAELTDEDDISPEDDDFSDIVEKDAFGDTIAEQKKSADSVSAGSADGGAQPAGDEPASEPSAEADSAMDADGSAVD